MEEKEKTQFLGATFHGNVTFNGPMYDIHDNANVHIYTQQPDKSSGLPASEAKIKESLFAVLEATDEEGNRIFTEKGQWYAVYKVLSECHGYPSNMREFCDIMKNWGMGEVSPACEYSSVRKVPTLVSFPTPKVALWSNYKDKAEEKFKKQIKVSMKLMELLSE